MPTKQLSTVFFNYQSIWDGMIIQHPYDVAGVAHKIALNASRYHNVSLTTKVPWQVIGIIHYREGNLAFDTHLANGNPLTARTINEPVGLPLTGTPPFTWEEGAIAAIEYDQLSKKSWLTLTDILQNIELYNGDGYLKYHPTVPSPYLWSYTQWYTKGKYQSDGHFNPTLVDAQIGAAPLFRYLTDSTLGVIPHGGIIF